MEITAKTAIDIFEQVRSSVLTGKLKPGTALPSVRELASELEINRNTVAAAYKKLVDHGIVISRGRKGTFISEVDSVFTLEGTPPGLALKDLAGGNPAVALLPRITPDAGFSLSAHRMYGEPAVNPALESLGREWLGQDLYHAFELNLTNGAVDAIERLLADYLIAGDKVIVEDPCFLSSINTLKNLRLTPVGIPVDDEGMQDEILAEQLKQGAQAIIITPRAHNPTGCGLSKIRAARIRALLNAHPEILIIIDDHFSLLSSCDYYDVIPEGATRWALIRSTSKFLGPDMRLAFVASDTESSFRLRKRLNSGTNWVSHILQDIVTDIMQSPLFHKELLQVKETYRAKRENLIRDLKNNNIHVPTSHDGLNIWIPLNVDIDAVIMQLAQHGWLVRSGEVFSVQASSKGLRISVSSLNEITSSIFAKSLSLVLHKKHH
ncbi:putative transcriptional regulatory protein ptsJ [Xenorhabdus nematophila F1]|uniref:MocR-like B6 salvage transcription factor PtsJ n=1 Tax=Xenorhabdus nematophila TaxID=628 RepID=UPI000327532F|nr:transcriptional regulator PtsJ [Xenorhabdus nematophila]CCW32337.1 putative transcriptional regulatory protein ptsJ [Xenorhabdus nematophila F1]